MVGSLEVDGDEHAVGRRQNPGCLVLDHYVFDPVSHEVGGYSVDAQRRDTAQMPRFSAT
jgi:hypothetical protein